MIAYEIAAVDVHVFYRDTRRPLYLLLHRAHQRSHVGAWGMVNIKTDQSERPVMTAWRAIETEVGLTPVKLWSLDYLHSYYDIHENRVCFVPSFVVEVKSMKVELSDNYKEARWITYDQGLELLKRTSHKQGLQRVHEDVVAPRDRGAAFEVKIESLSNAEIPHTPR